MLVPNALRADSAARRLSERVWRGHLATTGQDVALKVAVEEAPLRGEVATLVWLARQGCAVPRVVAVDAQPEPGWVALEWCGDETLDRAIQHASAQRRSALGRHLAQALVQVETAFAPVTAQARAGGAKWNAQQRALRDIAAPWAAAAPAALAWLLGRDLLPGEGQALNATLALALDATPDVGSLDYNASNVVVDGVRLTFVDWAAVGVDWPERRLVQYGTATGSGAGMDAGMDGDFATAIMPGAVQTYAALAGTKRAADAGRIEQAVDAHDVLLLLTAAATLKMVAEGTAHAERAAAWRNVEERRGRVAELLRRRLVAHGPAEALRSRLRIRSRAPTHDTPLSTWHEGMRSRVGKGAGG